MEQFNPVQTDTKTCDKHGEFVTKFTMVGDRRIMLGACPECARIDRIAEDERRRADDARREQSRLEARLARAGIPLRFRSRTLDSFNVENEGQRKVLATADDFLTNWDQHYAAGTMVVFSGPPGTGKSHLAIGIALALMEKGVTAFYTNTLDAIRLVRDTWRKGSEKSELEVLEMLGSVGLLILDEVGMQFGTDGEQIQVFDIINRRYQDAMPTILLTNLGKPGLKEFLGDRSFDRLREDGIWTVFDWESQRPKMRAA